MESTPFNQQTTIMVVDDDPINLLILSTTLKKLSGVEVHTFTNATEALRQCELKVWDLVVVDYQMPELDGLAFTKALRGFALEIKHTHTPVLMVTASSDPQVKHALLEQGTVDFLSKPVDPHELKARARNLITLHQMGEQLRAHNTSLKEGVKDMSLELAARERETLWVLAKVAEYRDNDTAAHLNRMACYSRQIARQLDLGEAFAEQLYLAAPMHDVGKVGIADSILLKPGKLNDEEWQEMKRHSAYGHDILGNCRTPVLRLGGEIAWCHHEAWDGSGYPRGISGKEIPLPARIVAVADIFDALTSERPYKKAWSTQAALAELRRLSGFKLDPECVRALELSIDSILEIQQAAQDYELEPIVFNHSEPTQDWLMQIEQLRKETQTDALTELSNRRRFEYDFERIYEQAKRSGQIGALLLIDINEFKAINDRFGHAIGDKVLIEFGRLAKPLVRPYECLARIGGDEFAVVIAHSGSHAIKRLKSALQMALSQINLPNGEAVRASFGYVLMDGKRSKQEVFDAADAELYADKHHSKL